MSLISELKETLGAKYKNNGVSARIIQTKYLCESNSENEKNVLSAGWPVKMFWLMSCGKNINEHNAAPTRLNAANNPRSRSTSALTNWRHKNASTVVELPSVIGLTRSLITKEIFP